MGTVKSIQPAQGPAPPPADIDLSIDRLSVEGLSEADARRLAGSLERRLAALMHERGLPSGLSGSDGLKVDHLDLSDLRLKLGPNLQRGPERAGAQLAEALWSRWQRPLDGGSSAVPGTSQAVPGTSQAVPGTSQAVPGTSRTGTSQAVPGTSRTVPGTSRTVPGTSRTVPGTSQTRTRP